MSYLNKNWEPEWGEIITWFGVDKHGKVALFLNNGWGWIPKPLLNLPDLESSLDQLSDFIDENKNRPNTEAIVLLDMYAYWTHTDMGRDDMEKQLEQTKSRPLSSANLVADYGFFIYQGVEGYEDGEDYPVGYEGESKRGDYYRYLLPSSYGSIDMLPKQLHPYIAMSDILDFTKDRLLDNNRIDEYFPRTATGK